MIYEVKARYSNGATVPLEPLSVESEECAALSVSIAIETDGKQSVADVDVEINADDGDCINGTLDALYAED